MDIPRILRIIRTRHTLLNDDHEIERSHQNRSLQIPSVESVLVSVSQAFLAYFSVIMRQTLMKLGRMNTVYVSV